MPLLKPDLAKELMAEILPPQMSDRKSNRSARMREALDNSGLTIEECAQGISNTARYSSDENLKYKAIQDAIKCHGVFSEQETSERNVSINIVIPQDTNGAALALLIPR